MGPLPDQFGLAPDRSLLRFRGGTVLAGGHPGRITTLTPAGAAALDALIAGGTATDPAIRAMAGRLVESGMAHPRRPPGVWLERAGPGVTVVVPVHDRPDALDRCLASLGTQHPVVVVDDASHDPGAVAAVCTAHGAALVRRTRNGGPGVARNAAIDQVESELVAFVDSDCTASPGWLDGIIWLFDDPGIGAVAPRIVAAARDTHRAIDRFNRSHSPLDLGTDEGEVGPRRAVRYVPTAALVVRRDALAAVTGFDPDLRVGEDVDLVWRLLDAGWRVRYQPTVTVSHAEPRRWLDLIARRFRYGTSAAPLAVRHPGRLAPVELRTWPTIAAVAALAGRPRTAAAAVAISAAVLARSVRPLGIPSRQAWAWSTQGAGWTLVGLGRAATMLAGPGLTLLAVRGRRRRRGALALVLVPPVVEWVRRRPDLDIARWVAASVADDAAYGAGVWTGCLRSRTFGPVLPASGRRPR
jgi:mycofactocin system glycosyltransferase